jgi:hypothetical protein
MGDSLLSPLHELFFRHPPGEQSYKLRCLSTLLLSGLFNVQAVPFLGKKRGITRGLSLRNWPCPCVFLSLKRRCL